MYCLNMLTIALELARTRPAYEDVATKFFEHFIYIADAINHLSGQDVGLWNPEDGFFYDVLHLPDGTFQALKVRSSVGLVPLFAVGTIEADLLERLPRFRRRMEWFVKYRPQLVSNLCSLTKPGEGGRLLLSFVDPERLGRIMRRVLDPAEFLSDYGVRSLSKHHASHPYTFVSGDEAYTVGYEPAESRTGLFGGNSNWRGPLWFPLNYLLIEALREYHRYYGNSFTVELPTGSGSRVSLDSVANDLGRRLARLFLRDAARGGRRPVFGDEELFQTDPHWRDHALFYEYFNGDSGAGIGASHQTGWTALVAKLIQDCGGKV